jgi:ferredoxin
MSDDDKYHRRHFFRESLARLASPLADFLEKDSDDPPKAPGGPLRLIRHLPPKRALRPPGAVPELIFARTCDQSGECVEACPANAIKFSTLYSDDPTPIIDASITACVVCDGLKCTHVCPSGALRPLAAPEEINMGLAIVNATVCVRGGDTGDADHRIHAPGIESDCTICVDHCPMGEAALRLDGAGPPIVDYTGCVGCGVCEQHCPTAPKAIVVEPR